MPPRLADALVPGGFVLIWSTGFVVARLVAPHAEPLTFLTLRFALAAALLAVMARLAGARWPANGRAWGEAAVAGLLLHFAYLAGVFWAVSRGLPAGIAALIAGFQPIATALVAGPVLGERVSGRRWAGIAAGFAGIALVLAPRIAGAGGYPPAALAAAIASLAAITAGTIWQKRIGGTLDLRVGAAIQFAASAAATGLLATLVEDGRVDGGPAFWFGLLWAALVLSIGGIALFLVMVQRGAVVAVASLFFLVPPLSAAMAWILFGEALAPVQLAGMAVSAAGVAVASRG